MARTPIASALQDIARDVAAGASGASATRRQVIKGAGAVALGVGLQGAWLPPARAAGPRVVVVGAGLAGLTAAYRLRQAGHLATVVEGSDRVGGRCWTIRGAFDEGQVAERGGELIDQGHTAIRALAQELRLPLDNLLAAEQSGTEPLYWFDGAPYTYAQATDDIKAVWQQLHKDVTAASYPTLYNLSTERGRQLDEMSITDWIVAHVPGGSRSRLGQLLDVAYTIEYGAECSVQSSLNLLYLLAYTGQGQLRIFGKSDEKYHVRGGNDQITDGLAERLAGQVRLGTRLVALADRGDGTWAVTTTTGGRATTVTADRVVLALPFSMLRTVDLTRAGFPALKMTAVRELAMGTSSKLQLQFDERHWRTLGGNGDTYADTGYQSTWEVTRAQPGRGGILVDYTGGLIGADFGRLTRDAYARRFLGQIEPLLPGLAARWNGRVTLDSWATHPWSKGSYSYWKVGQYTGFSGVEKEPVGTCHFAGEHTSQDFQGYLNGAVETGNRAASEILAALK